MTCMCGASVVPDETGIETEDGDVICDWCLEERFDQADGVRCDAADNLMDMRSEA
jgi:hypothetical protein